MYDDKTVNDDRTVYADKISIRRFESIRRCDNSPLSLRICLSRAEGSGVQEGPEVRVEGSRGEGPGVRGQGSRAEGPGVRG